MYRLCAVFVHPQVCTVTVSLQNQFEQGTEHKEYLYITQASGDNNHPEIKSTHSRYVTDLH
jgi:hypothetical protein